MTPVFTLTMLTAAFCGLTRRFVASLVGATILVMIGLAHHMLARQPASVHHAVSHACHLALVFNATYAAFALLSALML